MLEWRTYAVLLKPEGQNEQSESVGGDRGGDCGLGPGGRMVYGIREYLDCRLRLYPRPGGEREEPSRSMALRHRLRFESCDGSGAGKSDCMGRSVVGDRRNP